MADVLLVDDDGSVLLTLAIALRRRGHAVTMVGDGLKALELLQARNFQFLVSDVRMPGMSGFELARQVHALSKPPRVILTSAYSNIGTPNGAIEAFLQKPVEIAFLDELLHRPPPTGSETRAAHKFPHEGAAPKRSLLSTGH